MEVIGALILLITWFVTDLLVNYMGYVKLQLWRPSIRSSPCLKKDVS